MLIILASFVYWRQLAVSEAVVVNSGNDERSRKCCGTQMKQNRANRDSSSCGGAVIKSGVYHVPEGVG